MGKYRIKCKQCGGHYVVRAGQYGLFGGCSHYPKCRSTMQMAEILEQYFKDNGINIYCWKRKCWKCNKETTVYSYYIAHQLTHNVSGYFSGMGEMGIGDIPVLDKILQQEIETVNFTDSATIKKKYLANICEHCRAMQGHNYIVDEPWEIMFEKGEWEEDLMEKYYYKTLFPEDVSDIVNYYDFPIEERPDDVKINKSRSKSFVEEGHYTRTYILGCKKCEGYYVIRTHNYELFGGCSCFPDCRSTISMKELLRKYFKERGIRIYCWDEICIECGKKTKYYTYYLNLQLSNDMQEVFGCINANGLGDVPALDEVLAQEIESIEIVRFNNRIVSSKMRAVVSEGKYFNKCIHCGSIQDHLYSAVVDIPESDIEAYYYKTLYASSDVIEQVIDFLMEDSIF